MQIFLRFQQKAWGQKETFVKYRQSEAPRPQAGASRKGNIVLIVPLDPAYEAGLAGHLPAKDKDSPPNLQLILKKMISTNIFTD